MSRISKAVELARKEGAFLKSPIESNGDHAAIEADYVKTNKVIVSHNVLRKNRVLTAISDHQVIDTYRLLRTRVLRRMRQNAWKSLGVTSAGKNDGKTLTSINLGISIAMKQNYSVVVVDTDLRNPSVHKLFGFEPEYGLVDYLKSNVPLDKVLVNPDIDRLVILPGNKNVDASSELLSSPKMSRLAKDLKTRYPTRIVIYDLPPVLVGDDVVAFAPNLDTALFVVEEGGTDSDKLKRSIQLLEGIDIIGTVLNKSKESPQNDSYYY